MEEQNAEEISTNGRRPIQQSNPGHQTFVKTEIPFIESNQIRDNHPVMQGRQSSHLHNIETNSYRQLNSDDLDSDMQLVRQYLSFLTMPSLGRVQHRTFLNKDASLKETQIQTIAFYLNVLYDRFKVGSKAESKAQRRGRNKQIHDKEGRFVKIQFHQAHDFDSVPQRQKLNIEDLNSAIWAMMSLLLEDRIGLSLYSIFSSTRNSFLKKSARCYRPQTSEEKQNLVNSIETLIKLEPNDIQIRENNISDFKVTNQQFLLLCLRPVQMMKDQGFVKQITTLSNVKCLSHESFLKLLEVFQININDFVSQFYLWKSTEHFKAKQKKTIMKIPRGQIQIKSDSIMSSSAQSRLLKENNIENEGSILYEQMEQEVPFTLQSIPKEELQYTMSEPDHFLQDIMDDFTQQQYTRFHHNCSLQQDSIGTLQAYQHRNLQLNHEQSQSRRRVQILPRVRFELSSISPPVQLQQSRTQSMKKTRARPNPFSYNLQESHDEQTRRARKIRRPMKYIAFRKQRISVIIKSIEYANHYKSLKQCQNQLRNRNKVKRKIIASRNSKKQMNLQKVKDIIYRKTDNSKQNEYGSVINNDGKNQYFFRENTKQSRRNSNKSRPSNYEQDQSWKQTSSYQVEKDSYLNQGVKIKKNPPPNLHSSKRNRIRRTLEQNKTKGDRLPYKRLKHLSKQKKMDVQQDIQVSQQEPFYSNEKDGRFPIESSNEGIEQRNMRSVNFIDLEDQGIPRFKNQQRTLKQLKFYKPQDIRLEDQVHLRIIDFWTQDRNLIQGTEFTRHIGQSFSYLSEEKRYFSLMKGQTVKKVKKELIKIAAEIDTLDVFQTPISHSSQLFMKLHCLSHLHASSLQILQGYIQPMLSQIVSQIVCSGLVSEVINLILTSPVNENLDRVQKIASVVEGLFSFKNSRCRMKYEQSSNKECVTSQIWTMIYTELSQLLQQLMNQKQRLDHKDIIQRLISQKRKQYDQIYPMFGKKNDSQLKQELLLLDRKHKNHREFNLTKISVKFVEGISPQTSSFASSYVTFKSLEKLVSENISVHLSFNSLIQLTVLAITIVDGAFFASLFRQQMSFLQHNNKQESKSLQKEVKEVRRKLWVKIKEVLLSSTAKGEMVTHRVLQIQRRDCLIEKILSINEIYGISTTRQNFLTLIEITEVPFLEGNFQYSSMLISKFLQRESDRMELIQSDKSQLNPKQLFNLVMIQTYIKNHREKFSVPKSILGYLSVLQTLILPVGGDHNENDRVSPFVREQVVVKQIVKYTTDLESHMLGGLNSFNQQDSLKILQATNRLLVTTYLQAIQIKNVEIDSFNEKFILDLSKNIRTQYKLNNFLNLPLQSNQRDKVVSKQVSQIRESIIRYWQHLIEKYAYFCKELEVIKSGSSFQLVSGKVHKYQKLLTEFLNSLLTYEQRNAILGVSLDHYFFAINCFCKWSKKLPVYSLSSQSQGSRNLFIQVFVKEWLNHIKSVTQLSKMLYSEKQKQIQLRKVRREQRVSDRVLMDEQNGSSHEDQDLQVQIALQRKEATKILIDRLIQITNLSGIGTINKSIVFNLLNGENVSLQRIELLGMMNSFTSLDRPIYLHDFLASIKISDRDVSTRFRIFKVESNPSNNQIRTSFHHYLHYLKGVFTVYSKYKPAKKIVLAGQVKENITQLFVISAILGMGLQNDVKQVIEMLKRLSIQTSQVNNKSIASIFFQRQYCKEIFGFNSKRESEKQTKDLFICTQVLCKLFKISKQRIKDSSKFLIILENFVNKITHMLKTTLRACLQQLKNRRYNDEIQYAIVNLMRLCTTLMHILKVQSNNSTHLNNPEWNRIEKGLKSSIVLIQRDFARIKQINNINGHILKFVNSLTKKEETIYLQTQQETRLNQVFDIENITITDKSLNFILEYLLGSSSGSDRLDEGNAAQDYILALLTRNQITDIRIKRISKIFKISENIIKHPDSLITDNHEIAPIDMKKIATDFIQLFFIKWFKVLGAMSDKVRNFGIDFFHIKTYQIGILCLYNDIIRNLNCFLLLLKNSMELRSVVERVFYKNIELFQKYLPKFENDSPSREKNLFDNEDGDDSPSNVINQCKLVSKSSLLFGSIQNIICDCMISKFADKMVLFDLISSQISNLKMLKATLPTIPITKEDSKKSEKVQQKQKIIAKILANVESVIGTIPIFKSLQDDFRIPRRTSSANEFMSGD